MIYAKLLALLIAILALLGLGYHLGEMPYKAKYEAMQAANWQNKAQAEQVAKAAIAGQLVELQTQIRVNADAMQALQQKTQDVVADRDATLTRVRHLEQLLVVAARVRPADSSPVPAADSGSAAAGTGGEGGPTEIEQLLIDAKEEAERNADRLDTLILEITPQVKP